MSSPLLLNFGPGVSPSGPKSEKSTMHWRSLARCDKLAWQSWGLCDKLATAGGDSDQHVGIMPVLTSGILVCLFSWFFSVCLSAGFLVTDISDVCWHRAMKLCRMVHLGVHQVIFPYREIWPRVSPLSQKVKNFANTCLIDRLRDRAEIL